MHELITSIVPEAKVDDVLLANELDCLASLILQKTNVLLDPAKDE